MHQRLAQQQNKAMAVYKATKDKATEKQEQKEVTPQSKISDESMARLAKIMNDTPTRVKLDGTEWRITALKPGTQWLIAEEACKIVEREGMTMGDIVKQFAVNLPSVCRVLTLALLNDREKIEGAEYKEVYDRLMWGESGVRTWAQLLAEVLNMIDVDFFFASTNVIKTLRQSTLDRKTMAEERS